MSKNDDNILGNIDDDVDRFLSGDEPNAAGEGPELDTDEFKVPDPSDMSDEIPDDARDVANSASTDDDWLDDVVGDIPDDNEDPASLIDDRESPETDDTNDQLWDDNDATNSASDEAVDDDVDYGDVSPEEGGWSDDESDVEQASDEEEPVVDYSEEEEPEYVDDDEDEVTGDDITDYSQQEKKWFDKPLYWVLVAFGGLALAFIAFTLLGGFGGGDKSNEAQDDATIAPPTSLSRDQIAERGRSSDDSSSAPSTRRSLDSGSTTSSSSRARRSTSSYPDRRLDRETAGREPTDRTVPPGGENLMPNQQPQPQQPEPQPQQPRPQQPVPEQPQPEQPRPEQTAPDNSDEQPEERMPSGEDDQGPVYNDQPVETVYQTPDRE